MGAALCDKHVFVTFLEILMLFRDFEAGTAKRALFFEEILDVVACYFIVIHITHLTLHPKFQSFYYNNFMKKLKINRILNTIFEA